MNSETWLVEHLGTTYVAKRVPTSGIADLMAGCEVASALAEAGVRTGRPKPTVDGQLVLSAHGLALLEHVPGRELDGETDEEQGWIAGTLAGIHRAGGPTDGPSPVTFMRDWLSPTLPGVGARPWLARVIETVRRDTNHLSLTWTMLHTDPAPEAFVHDDDTGVTGLIDWAGATRGPVLYDVASAMMYLGGSQRAGAFSRVYLAEGPLDESEMKHLDPFRRFREAVQAAYFAQRLATGDRTGGVDDAENHKGLDDARRRLASLGLDT